MASGVVKSTLNNHYSTNRVQMGLTYANATFTCPSDGLLWMNFTNVVLSTMATVAINGIPRAQGVENGLTFSIPVFKGDVIQVLNGYNAANGGYFYPKG